VAVEIDVVVAMEMFTTCKEVFAMGQSAIRATLSFGLLRYFPFPFY